MFLINNEESEVLENDSFREDSMRRHDTIDCPIFKTRKNLRRFLLSTEPCQNCETNSEIDEAFLE